MKLLLFLVVGLISCLTGCGGGGGSATGSADAESIIIADTAAITTMNFTIGDETVDELIVENMSFKVTSPNSPAGTVDITFKLSRLGKEVVGDTQISGSWAATNQENGTPLITVSQILSASSGVSITFEAYRLGIQILNTQYQDNGLPLSRDGMFTDGLFLIQIDGVPYRINAQNTQVHIEYSYS